MPSVAVDTHAIIWYLAADPRLSCDRHWELHISSRSRIYRIGL